MIFDVISSLKSADFDVVLPAVLDVAILIFPPCVFFIVAVMAAVAVFAVADGFFVLLFLTVMLRLKYNGVAVDPAVKKKLRSRD